MKFLVDQSLTPFLASNLQQAGYDTVHTRDYGMQRASDAEIMARAETEDRFVISGDTDFGTLLALSKATKPSVILFRGKLAQQPVLQVTLLNLNLPNIQQALTQGCIVIIEEKRIRIRNLPI
jgi:predicted nuclease of predicted toxin-antitoxin system